LSQAESIRCAARDSAAVSGRGVDTVFKESDLFFRVESCVVPLTRVAEEGVLTAICEDGIQALPISASKLSKKIVSAKRLIVFALSLLVLRDFGMPL